MKSSLVSQYSNQSKLVVFEWTGLTPVSKLFNNKHWNHGWIIQSKTSITWPTDSDSLRRKETRGGVGGIETPETSARKRRRSRMDEGAMRRSRGAELQRGDDEEMIGWSLNLFSLDLQLHTSESEVRRRRQESEEEQRQLPVLWVVVVCVCVGGEVVAGGGFVMFHKPFSFECSSDLTQRVSQFKVDVKTKPEN